MRITSCCRWNHTAAWYDRNPANRHPVPICNIKACYSPRQSGSLPGGLTCWPDSSQLVLGPRALIKFCAYFGVRDEKLSLLDACVSVRSCAWICACLVELCIHCVTAAISFSSTNHSHAETSDFPCKTKKQSCSLRHQGQGKLLLSYRPLVHVPYAAHSASSVEKSHVDRKLRPDWTSVTI